MLEGGPVRRFIRERRERLRGSLASSTYIDEIKSKIMRSMPYIPEGSVEIMAKDSLGYPFIATVVDEKGKLVDWVNAHDSSEALDRMREMLIRRPRAFTGYVYEIKLTPEVTLYKTETKGG